MRAFRRKRRPGNRAQTKTEAAYVDLVKRSGCLCCIEKGYPHDEDGPLVQAHHVLSGGLRIGHGSVIGLCDWHHNARLIVQGWSFADHRERLGPSLLEGGNAFHEEFGEDDVLLEKQRQHIERVKHDYSCITISVA